MAFGRTSWGPPAGMGTLRTMGTGPPVSIGSPSRLLLELLDSLPESSESLLLDELELELAGLPTSLPNLPPPPPPSATVAALLAVWVDPMANVLAGGFGGTGIEAKIAAVDDVEVTEVISGGLVGVVCGGLLRPPREVTFRGRETISGLPLDRGGGFCLARATAFVIFAAATAETFVEALDGFLTPPVLTVPLVLEAAEVAMELSRAVALAMPCLVSWEGRTEEGGGAGWAGCSDSSL